jgi:hypothetical protein
MNFVSNKVYETNISTIAKRKKIELKDTDMENIIAEFFTIYAADGLTGPF